MSRATMKKINEYNEKIDAVFALIADIQDMDDEFVMECNEIYRKYMENDDEENDKARKIHNILGFSENVREACN